MFTKFPSYLYQRKRKINVSFTREFFAFTNSCCHFLYFLTPLHTALLSLRKIPLRHSYLRVSGESLLTYFIMYFIGWYISWDITGWWKKQNKKAIQKKFKKFTRKLLCLGLFSIKLQVDHQCYWSTNSSTGVFLCI